MFVLKLALGLKYCKLIRITCTFIHLLFCVHLCYCIFLFWLLTSIAILSLSLSVSVCVEVLTLVLFVQYAKFHHYWLHLFFSFLMTHPKWILHRVNFVLFCFVLLIVILFLFSVRWNYSIFVLKSLTEIKKWFKHIPNWRQLN